MIFTDDNPRMLKTVNPNSGDNPVFLSNHSQHGFNIRHFYFAWKNNEFAATKKGIAIRSEDAPILVAEIVQFMNDCEILPGVTFELVSHETG